jgi:hypothetical protein
MRYFKGILFIIFLLLFFSAKTYACPPCGGNPCSCSSPCKTGVRCSGTVICSCGGTPCNCPSKCVKASNPCGGEGPCDCGGSGCITGCLQKCKSASGLCGGTTDQCKGLSTCNAANCSASNGSCLNFCHAYTGDKTPCGGQHYCSWAWPYLYGCHEPSCPCSAYCASSPKPCNGECQSTNCDGSGYGSGCGYVCTCSSTELCKNYSGDYRPCGGQKKDCGPLNYRCCVNSCANRCCAHCNVNNPFVYCVVGVCCEGGDSDCDCGCRD